MGDEFEFELVDEVTEADLAEVIEYKYVLGQDPGGTTGVAMLRYTDNTPPELIYLHQIPDGREGFFYFFIGTEVGEGTDVVSVSEKFILREGVHGANLEPVYIEGVQYAIWVDQTEYQSPAVKAVIGDEFLKVNNLWTEGKRHQMDALLHALYYLRDQGHEPTLKALSGDLGKPLAEPGEADEKTLPQPGGSGGEEGESGEGEGEAGGERAQEALERMLREISKFDKAAEAVKALGDSGDGEPIGGGSDKDDYEDDGIIQQARPKRSLNGAFIGFAEDDD